jgi:hypothetical protein
MDALATSSVGRLCRGKGVGCRVIGLSGYRVVYLITRQPDNPTTRGVARHGCGTAGDRRRTGRHPLLRRGGAGVARPEPRDRQVRGGHQTDRIADKPVSPPDRQWRGDDDDLREGVKRERLGQRFGTYVNIGQTGNFVDLHIYQVRPAYADAAINDWQLYIDEEWRARQDKEMAEETERDRERAARRAIGEFPGLTKRLRRQYLAGVDCRAVWRTGGRWSACSTKPSAATRRMGARTRSWRRESSAGWSGIARPFAAWTGRCR